MIVRALSLSPLRWCGRLSYGVYLWHVVWFSFLRRNYREWPSELHTLVGIGATVAVATGSYYLLERRFLRMKLQTRER